MKTHPLVRFFAALCVAFALSVAVSGQTWTTSGTGNWFDTANWSTGVLPGAGPDVTNIINSGTAVISSGNAVVTQNFSIGYAAVGNTTSVGGLVIEGNGTLTMGAVQTYIGRRDTPTTSGTGYVSIRDTGYWLSNSEISVGRSGNGSTGYLEIIGSGSLKAKGVHFGHSDTSVGTGLFADNARITTGGVNSIVGGNVSGGSASVTMSGSAFWENTANAILLANLGSGTMMLTESSSISVTTANATAFSIGHNSSGRGTLVVSGSSYVGVNAGTLLIGSSGKGNLTIEDDATVSALTAIIASVAGSSGTINLFGGVLTTGTLEHRLGIGALNFDGGTLRAKKDGMIVNSTNASSFSLNSTGAGAFIDSGSFRVAMSLTLAGDGGLEKLGTGEFQLTGTQAYTGATTVASGTLVLGVDDAIASSSAVNVATGGVLNAVNAQTLNNLSGDGSVVGTFTVGNLSNIVLNSTADNTYAGDISFDSLEKTGAGTLTFAKSGSVGAGQTIAINQGALNITSGTLFTPATGGTTSIAAGGTLGLTAGSARIATGALTLANGAAVNALGYTPALSSTTTLVTTGETVTGALTGVQLFVDGQQVAATTDKYLHSYLALGAGGRDLLLTSELFWNTTGTAHGTFNIASGDTFALPVALADRVAATYTALDGWDGKSLTKTGAGTLEFTTANTYTGTTTVASGTLRLAVANAIAPSTAVNLSAGSTLDVTAGAQTLRNLSGDGSIRAAATALTLNSNAATHYDGTLATAGSVEKTGAGSLILGGAGAFATTGALTVSQGALSVTRGTLDTAGTLTLATSATLGIAGGTAKITTDAATFNAGSYINILSGTGTVNLIESDAVISTFGNLTALNNGVSNSISLDIYNTYALQLDATQKIVQAATTLLWTSAGQAHGTFNIADGVTFAPAVALGDRTSGFTAFAGWDGKTLTKTGLGTLAFNTANTYTGTTTVSNGTLRLTAANAIASSTAVNLASGIIEAQGAQQTLQNLTGSGTLLNNSTLSILHSTLDTAFSGVVTGAGSIVKTGTNTLTLSGSNDYTGGSTISSGKLIAASASALGTGTVTNNAALEFANATDGIFEASLVGTGTFTKSGAGALTANGTVFKTASATVTGGTLSLGDATHAITGSAGGVTVGAGTGLVMGANSALDVGGTLSLGANSTLGFIVGSGTGPVIRAGGATIGTGVTLNLAGITGNTEMPFYVLATDDGIANDFANITIGGATGGTADYITVSAGKTDDGKAYKLDTFLTWIQTSDVRHGTFTLNAAAESFTVGQVLADNTANSVTGWDGKSLTKAGAGTLILAAANTYTGTTLVNAGTLRLDTANAIAASTAVDIAAGAVLEAATGTQTLRNLTGSGTLGNSTFSIIHSTLDTAFSGVVTGSGGIAKTGSAALTLSGANDYSGGTVITEGRLKAAAPASLGSGEIVNNAALELAVAADAALANTLSGSGALIKAGAAMLTMTASNTAFSGTARIDAGKLLLTNAAALGTADIITAAGATVEYSGIANATSQSAVMGTGTFVVTSSTLALAKGGAGLRDVLVNNSKLTLAHQTALGDGIANVRVGAGSQLLFAANGIRLDTVALTPGSTLGFAAPATSTAPQTATVANLALTGSANLLFNVNLGRAASGVTGGGIVGDYLRVTNSFSGTYSVSINPGAYRPTTYGVSVELINTPVPTAGDAIALSGTSPKITIGLIAYELLQGNGTELLPNRNSWYLADTGVSPVADVIFSAVAMAGVDWHYSLDSLNLRLGDIRATTFATEGKSLPDADGWVRVRGYRLNAESSLTGAQFHQYLYGATVGIDKIFRLEDSCIILGALVDGGMINRIFENGASGETRTISGGLYASWLHKAGWYADGVAKYDHNENSFNIRSLVGQPDDTDYKNDVQGLSLELGRRFQRTDGWWVELAAQGAIAWIGGAEYDTYPDHLRLRVEVDDATSVQYRGQVRFGRQFFSTRFHPYVKAGMARGETSGGEITAGVFRRQADFDGWRAELGAGCAWHFNPRAQLYLDYEYAQADSYDRPWSFNFGYRRAW